MAAHRYRFGRRIAAGATGEVYRGEFLSEGFTRPVAIKLMRVGVAHQAETEARLRDEARMVARVRHPSIVRVEDLCSFDGRLAVVMELVDGADLAGIRDQFGPLPPRAVAEIVQKVAGALQMAYTAPGPDGSPMGIVHRDIKPENIALDVFGEVKVLDFGAARARFAGREAETRDFVPGTLPYMSPERFQLDDGGVYGSPASDLWALGATAVEVAIGTPWSDIRRVSRGGPPQTRALEAMRAADLPDPLVELLTDLLAAAPEDRPTAEETAGRAAQLVFELPGEGLSAIARRAVEAARGPDAGTDDRRLGTIFTVSEDEPIATTAPTVPSGLGVAVPAIAGFAVALVAVALISVTGLLAWHFWPSDAVPVVPAAPVTVSQPPPPPAPEPAAPPPAEEPPLADPVSVVAGPPQPRAEPVKPPSSRPKPVVSAPPAAQQGDTVRVSLAKEDGVTRAWLDPGGITLPASVPPGSYTPSASFADGTHKGSAFTVEAGKPMKVNCYTGTCRARGE